MSYGRLGKFAYGPIPIAAFAQVLVVLSSIANIQAMQRPAARQEAPWHKHFSGWPLLSR
jgi:hypothetical protein